MLIENDRDATAPFHFGLLDAPPVSTEEIRHKVPLIPFRIDGVVFDPADISRFDGQELLYIVDPSTQEHVDVIADPELSAKLLMNIRLIRKLAQPAIRMGQPTGDIIVGPPGKKYPVPSYCTVHQHINWGGSYKALGAGWCWPDMTRNWRFMFANWNDCVSSVSPCTSYVVFWEHIRYRGSLLMGRHPSAFSTCDRWVRTTGYRP